MPADADIAFAIVMHLAPDHESALTQLLARHTRMSVEQVCDNVHHVVRHWYGRQTGLVDHVLPVNEMPAKLIEYAAHLSSLNGKPNSIREQIRTHLGKIHGLLLRRTGHAFSQYKESTFARR